jgi:G:T/U-mismatch repair DNA glycosylase
MDKAEKYPIERHPLSPFLPEGARLLMLGSFPPPHKRWCMEFYYPNFNNDMWRIFGLVFFADKTHFLTESKKSFCKERIEGFLREKGIALYDTATAIRRANGNASDKFLEIIEATDIGALLASLPACTAMAVTGQKAADTLCGGMHIAEPAVGTSSPFDFSGRAMRLYRLPSSSRAYPLKLEAKAETYSRMFGELGLLTPKR